SRGAMFVWLHSGLQTLSRPCLYRRRRFHRIAQDHATAHGARRQTSSWYCTLSSLPTSCWRRIRHTKTVRNLQVSPSSVVHQSALCVPIMTMECTPGLVLTPPLRRNVVPCRNEFTLRCNQSDCKVIG